MAEEYSDTRATTLRHSRRDFLGFAAASLTLLVTPAFAAAAPTLLAVRVWPSDDYTRVTLEHDQEMNFSHLVLKDPDRLVLDIEDVDFNSVLQTLPGKILEHDPQIRLIRAGRFKPGVVRIVIELKGEVNTQVFSLKPIGDYGHRLVMDLYPKQAPDPLQALLQQYEKDEQGEQAPAVGTSPSQKQIIKRSKRPLMIVIDPGHGGEDPGAVGRGGSLEKNVTLQIARRLKQKIDAQSGMRALLTRDGDFFIPLHKRVAKARQVRADLFISVHADAFVKPSASGSSVFVLSENGATSTAARWLANRENASDLIGGVNIGVKDPYLARTLLDLSQTATLNDSLKLAEQVLKRVGGINKLHKKHVEQAGFAVLKAPDIPSILVETAFISNPVEEKRLNDKRYQDKMANALLQGMRGYFAENPDLAEHRIVTALN